MKLDATDVANLNNRRLSACLGIVLYYITLVGVLACVIVLAYQLGFHHTKHLAESIAHVRNVHLIVTGVLGCLLLIVRRTQSAPAWSAKLALAAMPVMFLASADQLLTVFFEPLAQHSGLYISHPTRGWTLNPGWSGEDSRLQTVINNQGYRGPEIPIEKAEGERRIVFLGDSVTYGSGVREEAIFVERLRQQLHDKPETSHISIVNTSVTAYSPWQEYDVLINEGLEYRPDLIIQVFCLNDVLEKFRLERFGGYTHGFEPPPFVALEWSGFYRAAREWHAWRKLPPKEELTRLRYALTAERLIADPDAEIVRRGWSMALQNLANMAQVSRDHSIPFVVVMAPSQFGLDSKQPAASEPQRILQRFATEHDVMFVDLNEEFRRYIDQRGLETKSLFIDRLHLSEDGHALAASILCDFVTSLDWFVE